MAAFDALEKKGYIAPRKAVPLPKGTVTARNEAKKQMPGGGKAGLPTKEDIATPAPEQVIQPGIWAHNIAASMGFTDMPPEVEAEFAKLITQGDDPQAAQQKAIAYLRGTDWHKAKYPGFASGVVNGLWGTEADYGAWRSQVSDSYRRYYGRPPDEQELMTFAQSGYGANTVEQIGQGHAWAQANTNDVQYTLGAFDTGRTDTAGLEALGQQQVGRQSDLGTRLQSSFQRALQKMDRIFSGSLATPSQSLGGAGLSAPSLLGGRQNPDVQR